MGPQLRERLAHAQHQRRLRARYDEATAVPDPSGWGAFGRSWVVPPVRVEHPELVEIGDGVVVLENCWMSVVPAFEGVTARLVLEDGVRVGRGCQFSVAGTVVVERGALLGDFVLVADTYHDYRAEQRMPALTAPRPVTIGAGAVVAGSSVVLPGVTIGAGAVVDHHSVVASDVPPRTRVSGNPARQ